MTDYIIRGNGGGQSDSCICHYIQGIDGTCQTGA